MPRMSTQLAPVAAPQPLVRFGQWGKLSVRQKKRWLEILLSFEMKNAYDVFDDRQLPVLRVEEQGDGFFSFLKRIFLGPSRWFDAHVLDAGTRDLLLRLHRPFRFIFHRLDVLSGDGQYLGAIQKRWSWFRRIYAVLGSDGAEVATLFGPFWRPWTFEIRVNERPVGLLQKKWSGLAKELFTDADNFRLEMDQVDGAHLRGLVFAATVLVDVVHFERSKG